MGNERTIRQLLEESRCDDGEHAASRLIPMVYNELRALARAMMGSERSGHTLQATAVVNEAFVRLLGRNGEVDCQDRLHFFRLASREMRHVLVEHARARNRQKREGDRKRTPLGQVTVIAEDRTIDLLALDEALARLAETDPEKVAIVEMRFFGGLDSQEIASALGISRSTVDRKWAVAKNRLFLLMDGNTHGAG
jgi:RNA polymerase sigma factor (TIGR02999 family)